MLPEGIRLIYALSDPRTPEIVAYVGCTVSPRSRMHVHLSHARRADADLANRPDVTKWVAFLLWLELRPVMRILEEVPAGELYIARERHWIDFYRPNGLLNAEPPPVAPDDGIRAADWNGYRFW